jgi:NADH:ubiquinone oxidoreductase subunit F (NADH-binding)
MSVNLRGLSGRKGLTESLFREIVKAASSAEADRDILLKELSEKYLVGRSSVLSASSFYDFLDRDHLERKVFICNGTACLTSGKHDKLRGSLKAIFQDHEIGNVSCLGHCHSGTALMIGDAIHHADVTEKGELVIKPGPGSEPDFHTGTNAERPILLAEITDLEAYYGLLKNYTQNFKSALKEIELSELRGRGGAGFPVHIKLKTSADILSRSKFIVGNADEGDPGAFSDKWLLENRPHSILFGMLATGLITGADTGIIYIRGEYPGAVKSIRSAIKEFENQKHLFAGLSGGTFSFSFQVFEGAGAYICGEETSLLNSIEGLRPEVRSRPPFPAVYGLFGKPTILCNVETFANIWHILKEGGASYSRTGTAKSKGTKLVSLDGGFSRPGVYEVKMGTPLEEIINVLGGGTRYPVKAYQIGGPLGGVVPASMINGLKLDFESLSNSGFLLGHAGIVSIPADFSMMKFLLHLFEFVSGESCGKCFPCRIGSQRGYELLKYAAQDGKRISKVLFDDLLESMQLGSLCALGGGISLPVMNILKYFGKEVEYAFSSE